jgi:hypothetical protein
VNVTDFSIGSINCVRHGSIYIAFIIKPEKFWEKQRTSIGSAKYNFEVSLTRLKDKEFL